MHRRARPNGAATAASRLGRTAPTGQTHSGKRGTWPWHGWAGLALIAIGQTLIVAKQLPLSEYYFPFVWYGYLLTVDALTARLGGSSLVARRPGEFGLMVALGATFWWIFELYNMALQNWQYVGPDEYGPVEYAVIASVDFGVVLLAIWLTARLVMTVAGWQDLRWRALPGPSERGSLALAGAGAVASVLPFIAPTYTFPLAWVGIPLLLDPLNYLTGRPSVIGHMVQNRWGIPLSLAVAGPVAGLFWEFWNYWAFPKWYYTVPFVEWTPYLFEMPLPGYGGYVPFAFELYALYHFVRPLLPGKPAEVDDGLEPANP